MDIVVKNISFWLFGDRDYFRFDHPELFWMILLIPISIGVYFSVQLLRGKEGNMAKENRSRLMGEVLTWGLKSRFWVSQVLLLVVVVAMANPLFGDQELEVEQQGVDVVFALDVSKSMLAEDIQPNRLERAKHEISKVISQLGADRIAIVVFAGNAYLQLPLTSDHSAAKLYLDEVSTDLIPVGGTSLAKATEVSLKALPEDELGGHIVLISDGEGHEEDLSSAIDACLEKEVKVYTIGLGTAKGTTIPLVVNGRKRGVKKDGNGNVVVTKLDTVLLSELARETEGLYHQATARSVGVEEVIAKMHEGEIKNFGKKKYKQHKSRYQPVLLIALCLFLILLVLPNYKWKKQGLGLLLFFTLFGFDSNARDEDAFREANQLYADSLYQEAAVAYEELLTEAGNDEELLFNLGNAYYQLQEFDKALSQYDALVGGAKDKQKWADLHYNRGNVLVKLGKYEEALKSFKKALRANPRHEKARYNLSYVKRILDQRKQHDQKQQQDQNKQKQKKDDQQKDKKQEDKKDQKQDPQEEQKDQKQEQQPQKSKEEQDREKRQQEQQKKEQQQNADQEKGGSKKDQQEQGQKKDGDQGNGEENKGQQGKEKGDSSQQKPEQNSKQESEQGKKKGEEQGEQQEKPGEQGKGQEQDLNSQQNKEEGKKVDGQQEGNEENKQKQGQGQASGEGQDSSQVKKKARGMVTGRELTEEEAKQLLQGREKKEKGIRKKLIRKELKKQKTKEQEKDW